MKANTDYKGIINRAYLGYESILAFIIPLLDLTSFLASLAFSA
ncbi:hypothetical protein [Romboutsia ilealis]|nr:hypothetical protein [Romboutsia ilealis]